MNSNYSFLPHEQRFDNTRIFFGFFKQHLIIKQVT